ncbi:MAG: PqqD family protein [Acidimicrobiales bacterium]
METGPTYVVGTSLVANEIDGETVVLNLGTGQYHGLNPVAASVWSWIQEPRSLDELTALVVSEFDVDEGRARTDLEALLVDLVERNLAVTDP